MATKKKTKRAAGKRKVKRETSDRVSTIAGKVLRLTSEYSRNTMVLMTLEGSERVTVAELRALAASCLAQDEQRGRRGK